ncbi:hypothetical protein [Pseudoalteromonas marina]|uniref:Uncharacterized protein n=1 Tax=Pseudoalteromonas marina TaxID=267375 RepID=A0ABT9FCE3_9GAMM|nr:hypothetical protein [Pseudoalteromonas marina]MDP2564463.1 hypothetical protein [Pseudoalteromonas marina]
MEIQLLFGVGLALVGCLYLNGRYKYAHSKFLAERVSTHKKLEIDLDGFCGTWVSAKGVVFVFDKDGTVDVIDEGVFFGFVTPKGGAMTLDYEVVGSVIKFSAGGSVYINKLLINGCVPFDYIDGAKLSLHFNDDTYEFVKLDLE